MLEIFALIWFCTQMGKQLRRKGWKPLWMQIGVVAGWIGGAFLGVLGYAIYVAVKEGVAAAQNLGFARYPFAVLGGIAGVGLLFLLAALLPNRTTPPLLEKKNA